jgi:hypothetical protein
LGLPLAAGTATAQTLGAPAALQPAFLRWTTGPVQLDGVLDEPAWRAADSLSDFTQLDPDEGKPATEATVVRLLGTAEGLYIGLVAHDSVPARIGRAQLRRDADLSSDDSFTILLDPQRDRRTGYLFSINPNGALYDAEILGPDDTNGDWDGRWDARARVNSWGWSAEIWLPWQTLRYGRNGAAWGLNLERFIRRKNEVALWRGWQRHQGLLFQETQGTLLGLDSMPDRPRAEIRPYLVLAQSQAERDFEEDGRSRILEAGDGGARIGGDVKLAVAPTLTLDLTLNSDFAQVEVDRQVVNLTRFPLQFPEKRPFFLESSGVFAMGEPGEVELFYSRRVGLAEDGTPIPLNAGARLHGRSGQYRVGVLAVRTGGNEDATDFVARVTRDVLSRGRVGAMVTSQHLPDEAGRWSAGLDLELPFLVGGQNLVASAYGATSRDDAGGSGAWGVSVDYPNDWSDSYLGVSRIGQGFAPALGFVREDGIQRYIGGFQFFPRPRGLGVRRLNLKPISWEVANDLDGERAYAAYEIRPFGVEFEGGAEMELNLQRFVDVPDERFEIFPGSVVPAGNYTYDRIEARYLSSAGRRWTLDLTASAGEFYDGTATEVEASVELRSAPHLITFVDYGIQSVRRPLSDFTAQVVRVGVDLAASPRFGGSVLMQWENESNRLTVNARLHWTPQPGSDVYLAWNSAWPTAIEGGIPWRRPQRGVLIGKLVHYFRL